MSTWQATYDKLCARELIAILSRQKHFCLVRPKMLQKYSERQLDQKRGQQQVCYLHIGIQTLRSKTKSLIYFVTS